MAKHYMSEKQAIAELKKLVDRWPPALRLFANGKYLLLGRADKHGRFPNWTEEEPVETIEFPYLQSPPTAS